MQGDPASFLLLVLMLGVGADGSLIRRMSPVEIQNTGDEHGTDGKLHGQTDSRWNHHAEKNDGFSDQEDDDRMFQSPERAQLVQHIA